MACRAQAWAMARRAQAWAVARWALVWATACCALRAQPVGVTASLTAAQVS